MNVDSICKDIAIKHNVKVTLVKLLYKAFWRFVKDKILEMELDKEYTEEEFRKRITSVTIPCIGRLACPWEVYKSQNQSKSYIKKIRNGQHKENKEDSTNV